MKRWILTASLAAMLAGSTNIALAGESLRHSEPSSTRATIRPVQATEGSTNPANPSMHHFDVQSSVQLSRGVIRDAYSASREAYTHKLQSYAKCSSADAKKAIVSTHPGMKVESVQLRNIKTNLVYVGLVEDDDNRFMVIVDAGNGKVLMDKRLMMYHERAFAD